MYPPRPDTAGLAVTILFIAATLCVSGCSAQDKKLKASDDIKALQQLVDLPAGLKSARWEMFGTPEYEGGVPGPTDYMTLVAEIEPVTNTEGFTRGTDNKSIYVVPEAARPWLSSQFRTMLEKNKNANIDLATAGGCHEYDTKIKKSGRKVSGFSCEKSGKVLVYLSIF
jgi:hypothetical protein